MNRKKLFGAFLALTALVGVSACGKETESSNSPAASSQTEAVSSSKESASSVSTPSSVPSSVPSVSIPSSTPTPSVTTPSVTTPVTPDDNFKTVLSQDFSDATIADKTDGATMYLDSSAKGSAVIEGDTKYAKITGNSSDTTLYLTTSGLDNGKIAMSFDFSLGGVQASWTLFQLYGTSEVETEPAEVFGFRTAKDSNKVTYIGYRTDRQQSTPTSFSSQLAYDGNATTWFHTDLSLDLGTGKGKVEVKQGENSYQAEFNHTISEVKALKFMAKSGSKSVCVDNVVVKHELGDFETVKAQKVTKLDALYNSYDLTKYTTNGATLTAKYNEAKANVAAATDFDKLNSAYNNGVAEIKAIKSDAEIAAEALANAKTAAIAEIRAEYDRLDNENNYTETERTELDSMRDQSITAINGAADVEEIQELVQTAKELLGQIPHTGTGSEVVTMKYSFDATNLTVGADKDACTQADFGSVVTMTGSVVKRNNSANDKVVAVELGKQSGGKLTFVATANATLTLTVGSSGSSNTSYLIVLEDDAKLEATSVAGGAVKDTTDAKYVVVTGTKYAENVVTYTLTKGKTYTICTMAGEDATISGRAIRIVTMNIA